MHDDGDLGVGAQFGTPLESLGDGSFGLLADFIYFLTDPGTYFEFNGNLTYEFPLENSTLGPFVLGGVNVGRFSLDVPGFGSASSTDVHLNAGGGFRFDAGSSRPLVAGRVVIGDGTGFVFWASWPFNLSSS